LPENRPKNGSYWLSNMRFYVVGPVKDIGGTRQDNEKVVAGAHVNFDAPIKWGMKGSKNTPPDSHKIRETRSL
jgi:hypothetical protein